MFEGEEMALWYKPETDEIWLECESRLSGSWFLRSPRHALYLPHPEAAGLERIGSVKRDENATQTR